MQPNNFGMYDEEIVNKTGLPVYSFEDPDDRYFPSDLWTYSDLKEILKIHLTNEERKNMIVAFQRSSKQQKGFFPLYSFHQIINKRYDTNVKFFPQFEE
ncbi:hypothetical protein [Metabacillus indicus]|uniref:hypothetical protein n=1 Tax=Metabacillus indicus TaxID=246786 RepID=UPI002492069D|nr:hypothetical protein [Metabacillus indicus]